MGIDLLGYFDDASRLGLPGVPRLGCLQDLSQSVRRVPVDTVYISLEHPDDPQLPGVLEELYSCAASVRLIPNLFAFDLLQSELQSVGGIPVMALGSDAIGDVGRLAKRGLDVVVAAVTLVLASPLMAALALAIKADSPGPVIFRQLRYGLNGEEIEVWKFRSMRTLENFRGHSQQAQREDRRVTRVGFWMRRASLDELPQLWNVLCGRMSLVGPRPHAVAHNEFYRAKIRGYMLRHKVRPGMTGWAQVNGLRGETETLEKMQRRLDYDMEYVRRWSLLLDIWILLRTIPSLLSNRNAY
ncbi:MAG: exopolysaccharide biosynthesis polyprenyl glycosylphosphotransferase [Terriglobales bacterium]